MDHVGLRRLLLAGEGRERIRTVLGPGSRNLLLFDYLRRGVTKVTKVEF